MKEKLVLNANFLRKESEFITRTCVVEKAVAVSHTDFERLVSKPRKDNASILLSENLPITAVSRRLDIQIPK